MTSPIEHARRIRARRAKTLGKLETGHLSLREALLHPPDSLLALDLWPLLLAPPGMGPETARRVCERARVWPHTELQLLSKRQIKTIIDELPERCL